MSDMWDKHQSLSPDVFFKTVKYCLDQHKNKEKVWALYFILYYLKYGVYKSFML